MPISTSVLPFDLSPATASVSPALIPDDASDTGSFVTADFADVFADITVMPAPAVAVSAVDPVIFSAETAPAALVFGQDESTHAVEPKTTVGNDFKDIPARSTPPSTRITEAVLIAPERKSSAPSQETSEEDTLGSETAVPDMPVVSTDEQEPAENEKPDMDASRPRVRADLPVIQASLTPPTTGLEQQIMPPVAVGTDDRAHDVLSVEDTTPPSMESQVAIDDEGEEPEFKPVETPAFSPRLRPFFGVTHTVPVTIPVRFVAAEQKAVVMIDVPSDNPLDIVSEVAAGPAAAEPITATAIEAPAAAVPAPDMIGSENRVQVAAVVGTPVAMATPTVTVTVTATAKPKPTAKPVDETGVSAPSFPSVSEKAPADFPVNTQAAKRSVSAFQEAPAAAGAGVEKKAPKSLLFSESSSMPPTTPVRPTDNTMAAVQTRPEAPAIAPQLPAQPPAVVQVQGENTPNVTAESPGKNLSVENMAITAGQAGPRNATPVKEKFAGEGSLRSLFRGNDVVSSHKSDKKVSLETDNEHVADHSFAVGTETANPVAPMLHDIRQTRLAVLPGDAPVSASGSTTTSGNLGHTASTGPESGGKAAVAAVEAIRQITDAADALWATDRTGVNLKLKLDDVGVAVSVAYRDGEIRATFHTDSVELRDALSSAWETHAVSVSDQKPYRFAEPVFSSSGSFSGGGSSSQGFSLGGDSSRHPSQQSSDGKEGFQFAGHPRAATGTTPPPAVVSTRPILTPDISGRLHAFA